MFRLLKDKYDKDVFKSRWISKVKEILNNCVFSHVWPNIEVIDVDWLRNTINQRINDNYKQNWYGEIKGNRLCSNYCYLKFENVMEDYLVSNFNYYDRTLFAKFHCGNHRLPITEGHLLNNIFVIWGLSVMNVVIYWFAHAIKPNVNCTWNIKKLFVQTYITFLNCSRPRMK